MAKYKRPPRIRGRAWHKKFELKQSFKVDWRGEKPRISLGVTAETFAASYIAQIAPPEPKPKYIIVKTDRKYVELRMYHSAGSYWFIERNSIAGKQFKSVTYTSRDRALRALEVRILWLECTALGEDCEE